MTPVIGCVSYYCRISTVRGLSDDVVYHHVNCQCLWYASCHVGSPFIIPYFIFVLFYLSIYVPRSCQWGLVCAALHARPIRVCIRRHVRKNLALTSWPSYIVGCVAPAGDANVPGRSAGGAAAARVRDGAGGAPRHAGGAPRPGGRLPRPQRQRQDVQREARAPLLHRHDNGRQQPRAHR